jgi:hypothetical protein
MNSSEAVYSDGPLVFHHGGGLGVVGMLWAIIAAQLAWPELNFGIPC